MDSCLLAVSSQGLSFVQKCPLGCCHSKHCHIPVAFVQAPSFTNIGVKLHPNHSKWCLNLCPMLLVKQMWGFVCGGRGDKHWKYRQEVKKCLESLSKAKKTNESRSQRCWLSPKISPWIIPPGTFFFAASRLPGEQ